MRTAGRDRIIRGLGQEWGSAVSMTEDQMRQFARVVLEEDMALHREREEALMKRLTGYVLIMVGIDTNQPDELIAKDLKDFRATIAHSQKWMKSVNQVQRVGTAAAVSTLVAGLLGALWMGLLDKIKLH